MQLSKRFDKDSIKKITKDFDFMTQISTADGRATAEENVYSPSLPLSPLN